MRGRRPGAAERGGTRRLWLLMAGGLVAALVAGTVRGLSLPARTPEPAASLRAGFPAAWTTYRAADGSFDVVAPSPGRPADRATPIGVEHEVRFPGRGALTYAVDWVDVPPSAAGGRNDAELVDAWSTQLAAQLGGRIDEEDLLRVGSFPGIGLRLSSAGRTYLVRVIAAHSTLYEVVAALLPGATEAERALADRFLGSFELLVP